MASGFTGCDGHFDLVSGMAWGFTGCDGFLGLIWGVVTTGCVGFMVSSLVSIMVPRSLRRIRLDMASMAKRYDTRSKKMQIALDDNEYY